MDETEVVEYSPEPHSRSAERAVEASQISQDIWGGIGMQTDEAPAFISDILALF